MGTLLARVAVVALAAAAAAVVVDGQMSPAFYDATCPALQSVVRRGMAQAVQKEARMGASILRLFFHDCFVNGCDASVLLDDTANFTGEKNAGPNANSLRGYEVIDAIKAQVEASCKATVSCADIVALAARDAVSLVGTHFSLPLFLASWPVALLKAAACVQLGGPSWTVQLGRRDGRSASQNAANTNLPPPDARLADLLTRFSDKGLDARALTALSGAHTVGWARCTTFRTHIYNDTGNAAVDAAFATQIRAKACPSAGGDGNLAPLELRAPAAFDNGYFQDLVARRVLLRSDQELYGSGVGDGSTDALVRAYAANATLFAVDFAAAMVRMGNLALTGKNGEVRLNCRRVN
ncbi:hypothetical protein CFC21_040485 [Triticum aestivum]|uniref:Peroxidase n=2 Tax=Triticum aestivum TaxID=4565 RepID=A0A3B6FMT3_WHEAT|nr:hypothetical protein CFC21_040485 [Triticum aestivum]